MYIHIVTMAKIVSLADDVYQSLYRMKGKESYSSVIRGLLKESSNKEKVLSFAGKGGIDDSALHDLRKGWKKWSEKYA